MTRDEIKADLAKKLNEALPQDISGYQPQKDAEVSSFLGQVALGGILANILVDMVEDVVRDRLQEYLENRRK